MKIVLTKMFKEFVEPIFHSSSRVLATKLLGTTPLVDILANLQRLYSKLSYQELDSALLRLIETMNRMQPVELMLRGVEEVQLFL